MMTSDDENGADAMAKTDDGVGGVDDVGDANAEADGSRSGEDADLTATHNSNILSTSETIGNDEFQIDNNVGILDDHCDDNIINTDTVSDPLGGDEEPENLSAYYHEQHENNSDDVVIEGGDSSEPNAVLTQVPEQSPAHLEHVIEDPDQLPNNGSEKNNDNSKSFSSQGHAQSHDVSGETPKNDNESSNAESSSNNIPADQEEENEQKTTPLDHNFQQYAMELNVALEALESMRRANLEVEFSTVSSSLPSSLPSTIPTSAISSVSMVHHDQCTYCQRETLNKYICNPQLLVAKIEKDIKKSNAVEGRNERGGIKFDGSRIRRFRNRLFSKSTTSASESSVVDADSNEVKKEKLTESSPPRLESPNNDVPSKTNVGEDDTNDGNATNNNNIRLNNNNNNAKSVLRKTPIPCLTCGHPTCSSHSSSTFSTKHIPICQPCAYLFELDFLVDVITTTAANSSTTNKDECRQKVNDMIDCYDRAKLLLTYTAQYTDEIALGLETRTARSNKIGAGSSATGIVSGVTGVIGCSALLFPPVAAVGVPLLIASLVFGGTATAAQTGDAAVQYFSEPDRLADKMVALHGMALSLLRITEVLNYGLLRNDTNSNDKGRVMDDNGSEASYESLSEREEMAREIQGLLDKHGVNTSFAGKNVKAKDGASMTGRHSRYIGRVGTTAMSSARFIPIAGGVLSAACLVVEGKELKRTLSRISEGNLSNKAEQIRTIREELPHLPDSSLIAGECRRVFNLAEKQKLKKSTMDSRSDNHVPESAPTTIHEEEVAESPPVTQGDNEPKESSSFSKWNRKKPEVTLDSKNFDNTDIADLMDEMQNAAIAESDRGIAQFM